MIRIILLGRTGNHLFQYALGRVLAERRGVPLVLDASWFNSVGWAEVSHFLRLPLQAQVVRRCSLGARALRKFTGKHYWEYRGVPVLKESPSDQSFDGSFLEAPDDCVLFGYFQTPRYFAAIAAALRNEMNGLLDRGAHVSPGLAAQLSAPGAVAVHVRRADYLRIPVFQVCERAYYRTAMARLRELLDKPKFYVFSDDPGWCRGEFQDGDQVVIDAGQAATNPLHDLRLMSLASHHIIANSSYSWWAAWLGEKPDQRVMMPEQWYAHGITAPIEQKRLPHWEIVSS
ncbi:MAG: alpha-1,2-fucosyltransferase [Verrucomicrobia bacterium]|nr:MAG: alpha-1,2-fucosyltransferase [Verrucomicrobiota bacterium]